jgi:hypothetical protein
MEKVDGLKVFALVPPGLSLLILAAFAFGETASGDWSGLGHLVQAVPIVLLMWLGWKRPLWGGILLLLLGFFTAITFSDALRGPEWLAPFLILVAPLLLSGLLLLWAARLERKLAGHAA